MPLRSADRGCRGRALPWPGSGCRPSRSRTPRSGARGSCWSAGLVGAIGGARTILLELPRRVVHLIEEPVVVRIAVGGVRASVAGRRSVLARRRPSVRDESLLLLEEHQERAGIDPACAGDLVDDRRSRLARLTGIRRAALAAGGLRGRRLAVALQAHVPTAARRHSCVQEGLDLRDRHGAAVVEDRVRDDHAGIEITPVGRVRGGHLPDRLREPHTTDDEHGCEQPSHETTHTVHFDPPESPRPRRESGATCSMVEGDQPSVTDAAPPDTDSSGTVSRGISPCGPPRSAADTPPSGPLRARSDRRLGCSRSARTPTCW